MDLQRMVVDTQARRITGLPNVSPTTVSAVTDSAICARVLAAYNTTRLSRMAAHLYVWRVGTDYIATDTSGATHYSVYLLFDSTLAKISLYLH